jgi:hypothetical protein
MDLEIIKTEISERAGGGPGDSAVSKYEIKQLEQQIAGYFSEVRNDLLYRKLIS